MTLRLVYDRDREEGVELLAAEFEAHCVAVEGQWIDGIRVTRGQVTPEGRQLWHVEYAEDAPMVTLEDCGLKP